MESMPQHKYNLVGREAELSQLKECLVQATDGDGSTVLISGEAGMGKTRLLEEFVDFTATQKVDILSGATAADTIHPFLLFSRALEEELDKPLFHDQEYTSFTEIFAINHAGMLMAQASPEGMEGLDADIFAGMLSAVQNFVRDSFDTAGEQQAGLGRLEYGDMKILMEHGKKLFLVAVFRGTEHPDMKELLKRTTMDIEKEHADILDAWKGNMAELEPLHKDIFNLASNRFLVYRNLEGVKLNNERIRIANTVLELLEKLTKDKTLLLVLEDLHWADESSLFVLAYLARNIKGMKVLIMGTMRPDDSKLLTDTMNDMDKEKTYTDMTLEKLEGGSVENLISHFYPDNVFPSSFVELLTVRCEGNPFFLLEYLRQMGVEGSIGKIEGKYALVSEDYTIPSSIEDVVHNRLEILEPDALAVAEYASCIGKEFERNTAMSITSLGDPAAALEKLQARGIIIFNNGMAEFSHALFQEIIYKETAQRWKMAHHKNIGEHYEIIFKNRKDEVLYELARHFSRSNEHEKALDYCFRAGEKAGSAFAAEQAIEYYEKVLALLSSIRKSGSIKEEEVRERLADIFVLTGNYDKALEYYDSTMEKCQEDSKARIHRKRAGVLEKMSKYKEAFHEIAKGEEISGNDAIEWCRLTLLKAFIFMRTGEYDDSNKWTNKALDKLKKHPELEKEIGDAYNNLGGCNYLAGNYEESYEYYKKSLNIAEKVGTQIEIANALNNVGMVLKNMSRLDESREIQQRSLTIREDIGDLYGISASCINIGMVYTSIGDLDKGLEYYERCLNICIKTRHKWGIGTAYNNMGNNMRIKGELKKALEFHKKSLTIEESIGDQYGVACSTGGLGEVCRDLGEWEQAEMWYNRCLDICNKVGAKEFITEAEFGLAQTFIGQGQLEKALDNMDTAMKIAVELGLGVQEATGHRLLGMVHRDRKEWDKSIESFENAFRLLENLDNPREKAINHYNYGLMWMEKGEPSRAREQLENALELSKDMGMKLWADRSKAMLDKL